MGAMVGGVVMLGGVQCGRGKAVMLTWHSTRAGRSVGTFWGRQHHKSAGRPRLSLTDL